jgi:CRISPR-associated protein Csa3
MRLIILTLGFDEKFAVRGILRYAPKPDDVIAVITASLLVEKAEKALRTLLDVLRSYAGIDNVKVVEVDVSSPELAKHKIRDVISKYREHELIANLSGGMRALILITLAAVLSSGRSALIELETENLENVVTLNQEFFKPESIDESDRRILRKVGETGEVKLDDFAELIGKSRTTTYRILKRLVNAGYLEEVKKGRGVVYVLSDKGRLMIGEG